MGLILAVLFLLIGGPIVWMVLRTRYGQGPLMDAAWVNAKEEGKGAQKLLGDTYTDPLLPMLRALRLTALGLIALGALVSPLILWEDTRYVVEDVQVGLHPLYGVPIIWAVFGIGALLVWLTPGERPVRGMASIAPHANQIKVTFPALQSRPIVTVKSTDQDLEEHFEVHSVTANSFIIEIDQALAKEVASFEWVVRGNASAKEFVVIVCTTFMSSLLMALTYYCIGLSFHSSAAVTMSGPYVLLAGAVFFKTWKFGAWFAKVVIGLLEFGPNALFTIMRAWYREDPGAIDKLLEEQMSSKTQKVNLANEEDFEPARQQAQLKMTAVAIPVFVLGMIIPDWNAFRIFRSFEIAYASTIWLYGYFAEQFLAYAQRKGNKEMEKRAEKMLVARDLLIMGSVGTYFLVCFLSLVTMSLCIIVGEGEEALLWFKRVVEGALLADLRDLGNFVVEHRQLVGGILLVLLLLAIVAKTNFLGLADSKFFHHLTFGGLGVLVSTLIFAGVLGSPAEAAQSLVAAASGKTRAISSDNKDMVLVQWSNTRQPGFSGVLLRRRDIERGGDLVVTIVSLPQGATSFTDTPGPGWYAYRVCYVRVSGTQTCAQSSDCVEDGREPLCLDESGPVEILH